jgi:hypothetical protein
MSKILLFSLFTLFGFFMNQKLYAQCCDYKLIMQDSYGDGWDGATLEVLVNNVSVGVFEAFGSGTTVDIEVCTGDAVALIYNPANWENEHSYILQDASYNVVFMDGPNPTPGSVFSGTADCDTPALPGSHPCLAMPLTAYDCYDVNNTGFPDSGVNPNCANFQGSDIWYKIVIPPSGSLSIETLAGSIDDTGVAGWVGNDCNALSFVGCDDDGGEGYLSFLLLYDLVPGDTLYIQAWRWGGGSGSFQMCIEEIQNVTLESSNLPIVIINTLGQTIVQDTKIDCLMEIKYNGPGNLTFLDGPANVYDGHIGIEIRGASSSGYPQRPYGFETRDSTGANLSVSILGMPEENDWVLISNYNDRSLIKNLMAYKIFAMMGNYSPRSQLCEVIIDGSYQGIYLIGEKIKQDNGRVNIATLNPDEILGDDLTGGYILQQNYWNESNSFQSNYSPIDHPTFDVHFLYEYPKPQDIVPEQKVYIAAFIDSLETALYSVDFADPIIGYRKYLDVESFIDYFIVNEVSRNNDGFKKSVFFHKDKNSNGGKLHAGPVWDFDWAWKNMQSCEIFQNNGGIGWAHHINDCFTDNYSTGWYIRLLQDSTFNDELRCRYEQYRETMLDTTYLFAYIDSMGVYAQEAQARHFQKWPLLGMSGPAPDDGPVAITHLGELDSLKSWIWTRLQWLDANIPGIAQNCEQSGVGLNALVMENSFNCYPNPASNQLSVVFQLADVSGISLTMVNAVGAVVYSENAASYSPGQHTIHIDVSHLQSGIYFLKVEIGGTILTQKIVVSR